MSCGVGCRRSFELVLLWLWHRLAAVAPIQPVAWELPYATDVALKNKKQTNKKKQTKKKNRERDYLHEPRMSTFFKNAQKALTVKKNKL